MVLLCHNVTAFALSRSLALLTAAEDSFLDLVSQLICGAMRGDRNVDKEKWRWAGPGSSRWASCS